MGERPHPCETAVGVGYWEARVARNRRVVVHNGPYLITCNVECDTALPLHVLAGATVRALERTRDRCHFLLHAYVIMPDHVHLLFTTAPPHDISRVIGSAKSLSAISIRSHIGGVGPTWQRRFHDHVCRNDREFEAALAYIYNNPVAWGLVESPHEWQWSSWYAYADGGTPPLAIGHIQGAFDASRVEWRRHPRSNGKE
jgi:REP element-mobilizing transposase RayT